LVPWIGLPGTFGGATVGNAGCFGLEMSDIFIESEVLDLQTGEIKIFKPKDMNFAYRESSLKEDSRYFVISTLIDLMPR
jgi:UDP-N-acetylmuramate dehydrogenase